MLDMNQLEDVSQALRKQWDAERAGLVKLDGYMRGDHNGPYQPTGANREYKLLAERAITNWMPLVVSAVAQNLYVEGYRRSGTDENAGGWDAWQANGLDARQAAVHRGALTFGLSYATVLPGVDADGGKAPVIRGVSPMYMTALYDDPAEDEWPEFAVRVLGTTDGAADAKIVRAKVYDAELVYDVAWDGKDFKAGQGVPHGLPVCPVVRFANVMDLEGRATGELEHVIPIQDRINQTAFDLLMTQSFGSFKIRTVSGMTLSEDSDEARVEKLKIAQDRFLVADDPDTKFGQLDETPLGGYIEALDIGVRHLGAVSQTPPHHLLGQMANLSAEALAAAESSLTRKVDERKKSFGESWEQTLRLAAAVAGDMEGAADTSAEIKWRDTEARSFNATVDALGKAAQMLGVPKQALWEQMPGVSQTDVERWKTLAAEGDAFSTLTGLLERQADGV